VLRDEARVRLAAEGAADPPRAELDVQPGRMRGLDDLLHRPAVEREVVLRERVQHCGEPARGEVVHIARNMAHDANAEVRAADRHPLVIASTRSCASSSWLISQAKIPRRPSLRTSAARSPIVRGSW